VPDVANLSRQVITALKVASEPSITDCYWRLGNDMPKALGEIFKNQSVTQFEILPFKELATLKAKFSYWSENEEKQKYDFKFSSKDFQE